MLRRIEPEAVICYSTPFAEMEGNVIPVDYGETNNLKPKKKTWYGYAKPNEAKGIISPYSPQSTWYSKKTNIDTSGGSYPVVKQSGYVITTGFGSGRVRGDKGNETGALKGKAADQAAKRLGYSKTNYKSHGQPVYKKGNKYITPDIDRHSGGVWKMAGSVKDLSSKSKRLGTYDEKLRRIGA